MTILSSGYRKARKSHWCDGWRWIEDFRSDIPELKICKGIKKGDKYYFENNTENLNEGAGTFKCCKQCKDQAEKYNILMQET